MQQGLVRLNAMDVERAYAALLRCCGSSSWANELAKGRPFESVPELLRSADALWWGLNEADWLEAFASHPQIGDLSATATRSNKIDWAAGEQAGVSGIDANLSERLANANKAYAARFGFIFIICATGKDAMEILRNLEARLRHDRKAEIPVAAEEQAQITRIRLNKLLLELEQNV